MPITFYDDCESLQAPAGQNGADGLSAVSQVKDFTTTIPQVDPSNLYVSGSLYASAVGAYGVEWLQVGVFFMLPQYGVFEVVQVGPSTPTETLIYYKNRGAAINDDQGTVVPAGTLIVPSGPAGVNGEDGSAILSGGTNPTSGTGQNGDFYINTSTNTLFGPKASGAWPAGVSLVGPAGPIADPPILTSGSGPTLTGSTGTVSLLSAPLSIAAGELCANNGDLAVLKFIVRGFDQAQTTTAARFRLFATINGNDATLSPNATTLMGPQNPLYASVPSVPAPQPVAFGFYEMTVSIQRLSATTASVFVSLKNGENGKVSTFESELTSVSFNFAAITTIDLFAERGNGSTAIRLQLRRYWIETYKS